MENRKITDEELLDFIDNALSEKEKQAIETQLKNNEALKLRYDYLANTEKWVATSIKKSPSVNFTVGIMDKIATIKNPYRKGDWLIWILALLSIILGSYYISDVTFNIGIALDTSHLPDFKYMNLEDSVSFTQKFNLGLFSKVLLYLLLFLSLMLFDKTVLRPYFKNRQLLHH